MDLRICQMMMAKSLIFERTTDWAVRNACTRTVFQEAIGILRRHWHRVPKNPHLDFTVIGQLWWLIYLFWTRACYYR